MRKITISFLVLFFAVNIVAQDVDISWVKSNGGNGEDIAYAICTDSLGNVYTTGTFEGTVDFDPGLGVSNLSSSGNLDVFIQKLDSNGNFIWAKSIGGTGEDISTDMAIHSSGDIVITGSFESTVDFNPGTNTNNLTSNGGADIYILKLNSNGSYLWAISMGGSASSDDDLGTSITLDNYGNIFTVGNFDGTADFDPGIGVHNLISHGSSSSFIQKLSPSGTFMWAQALGANWHWIKSTSVIVDPIGNVITTGYFGSNYTSPPIDFNPGTGVDTLVSNGNGDVFIQKLNTNGSFIWAKSFGGTGGPAFNTDASIDISSNSSGNIFITGMFEDTVDFDPGIGIQNKIANNYDIFILNLASNGNFSWVKIITGSGGAGAAYWAYDVSFDITTDNAGFIYSTSYFDGTSDFDPGSSIFNMTGGAWGNTYILKLSPTGNFIWAKQFDSYTGNKANAISVDNYGNIYTAGYYTNSCDFNPSTANYTLNSCSYNSSDDIFIHKLKPSFPPLFFPSQNTFTSPPFNVSYTNSSINTENIKWLWHFGNGDSSLLQNPTYSFQYNGIYLTTLYAIDSIYNTIDSVSSIITCSGGQNPQSLSFTTSQTTFTAPPFNTSFTNTSSGYHSYTWNFGDGNISNQTNPSHTYLYNGTYTVTLFATDTISNTTDTASTIITCSGGTANPCNFTAELTQPLSSAIICVGDSFRLSATPNNSVTYAWAFNGAIVSGATDSIFYAKDQGFYMAVLSNASCSKVTDNYFALANYTATTPVISIIGSIAPCSNDSLMLEASSGFTTYNWSNGKTGQSIYTSTSGRFTVDAYDNNTCVNTSAETIINVSLADIPKICAVTVDANTNHNIVKWQAVNTPKIDSFRVYRESSITNVYDYIGGVAYSAPLEVEDINSNVAVRQYAYKITAIDTCGKETPVSLKHKTMHLMVNVAINDHWNLIWRPYEGFSFGSYKIYRGTDSTNMTLLTTISSNNTSYTDLTNPSGDVFYQIEVVSNDPCGAKSYGTSRSNNFNTKNASGLGVNIKNARNFNANIYPNPNKGQFTLQIITDKTYKFNVEIYNTLGELIYTDRINAENNLQYRIDLQNISKGIYSIRLMGKDGLYYYSKIIIQ